MLRCTLRDIKGFNATLITMDNLGELLHCCNRLKIRYVAYSVGKGDINGLLFEYSGGFLR